jgi:hypothetical protein
MHFSEEVFSEVHISDVAWETNSDFVKIDESMKNYFLKIGQKFECFAHSGN